MCVHVHLHVFVCLMVYVLLPKADLLKKQKRGSRQAVLQLVQSLPITCVLLSVHHNADHVSNTRTEDCVCHSVLVCNLCIVYG